jgi:hypothetical protein
VGTALSAPLLTLRLLQDLLRKFRLVVFENGDYAVKQWFKSCKVDFVGFRTNNARECNLAEFIRAKFVVIRIEKLSSIRSLK